MKIRKKMIALFLAMALIFPAGATAYAHDVPDMSRTGSISVKMMYDQKAVSGGVLTIYRVGEICEDDGNYRFVLTEDYRDCGVSLDDLEAADMAQDLASYTKSGQLKGTEVMIGDDGRAFAEGLELGLYLIVQTEEAEGYEAAAPFLVSVPMNEEGAYIYNVDATPKLSTLTEKEPEPSKPAPPSDSLLPQTGQLNWPVPVLAVLGLCLILLGYTLRFGKRGMSHEA